jgi:hypothetical protein
MSDDGEQGEEEAPAAPLVHAGVHRYADSPLSSTCRTWRRAGGRRWRRRISAEKSMYTPVAIGGTPGLYATARMIDSPVLDWPLPRLSMSVMVAAAARKTSLA